MALIEPIKLSLLLLSVLGLYTTWYLFLNNGGYDIMVRVRDFGPHVLPGTHAPLKTSFTGIKKVDYQLGVLGLYFWQMVDGSRPDGSLLCFHFAGQFAACWGLLMIEGRRYGNRGKLVSFIVIWGIAMQNLALNVVLPLYLVIHLSTAPTVSAMRAHDFYIDPSELQSVPISLTLGFIVPAILLTLPAPSIISFDEKQYFMAVWQTFPIWVEFLQWSISLLHRIFMSSKAKRIVTSETPDTQWYATLRAVYVSILAIAGSTHIMTVTLLAALKIFPDLFAAKFDGMLSPSAVFWPTAFSSSTKMTSIGSAALLQLQFDEIIGSAAVALWATVLFARELRKNKKVRKTYMLVLNFIFKTALVGPIGYAVICIWARDELIFKKQIEESAKRN